MPKTGDEVFQRRAAASGTYYASPVAANGHIYFTSLEGAVTVLKAGAEKPVVVAKNRLARGANGSHAGDRGRHPVCPHGKASLRLCVDDKPISDGSHLIRPLFTAWSATIHFEHHAMREWAICQSMAHDKRLTTLL